MAEIALLRFRIPDTRYRLGHHSEVLLVVAERREVALAALGGTRRWMPVLGNRPCGRAVACRAVVSEDLDVRVGGLVAARTVQQRLLVSHAVGKREVARQRLGPVCLEVREQLRPLMTLRGPIEPSHDDVGQSRMVHTTQAAAGVVFLVAGHAVVRAGDVGMECRRLSLDQDGLVCMAGHASRVLHALHRRVARRTVLFEKRMCAGQGARRGHVLPRRGALHLRKVCPQCDCRHRRQDREQRGEDLSLSTHLNHRNPK